jgi:hypothetical protein
MDALWPIPIAAALVLAALLLYRPHIAGWLGDLRVGMALAGLPRNSYTLMHDVRLPDSDGDFVHIDHLISGPAGYDIVSTINLSGRIKGQAEGDWTQAPAVGEPRRIANPLAQNRQRAEVLGRLVGAAPVRTLTVAARARFPDGRPDGLLAAGELADRILALDTEAPPFDGRAGLRAIGLAMDAGTDGRRRRHYAAAWRNPAGHVLLASAACVLAFLSGPRPRAAAPAPAPVIRYVPVPLASDAAKVRVGDSTAGPPSAMVITTGKRHVSHHRRTHRRRRPKAPMQVVAMSDGLASIMENGHLITLRPGQKSPHGWRLVRATPRYADMIGPHGRHFHFTP